MEQTRGDTDTVRTGGAHHRRVVAALITLTALIITLVAPTLPAQAFTIDTDFESCLRSLHNKARQESGAGSLESRSDLVAYARAHSEKMAAAGKIFHSDNLTKATINWVQVGENVGAGYSCGRLHDAFMNSDGHRKNLLDPIYTAVGVGGGVGEDGRFYVSVVFAAYKKTTPKPTTTTTTTTLAPAPAVEPAPQPASQPKPKVGKPEKGKPKPAPTTTITTTTLPKPEPEPEPEPEPVADWNNVAFSHCYDKIPTAGGGACIVDLMFEKQAESEAVKGTDTVRPPWRKSPSGYAGGRM